MEGKKTLSSSDYSGSYIRTDIYLAFPGMKNTHSTRVKMRAESQNKADYLFRDNINFIAGYQNNFNFTCVINKNLNRPYIKRTGKSYRSNRNLYLELDGEIV